MLALKLKAMRKVWYENTSMSMNGTEKTWTVAYIYTFIYNTYLCTAF